LEVYERWAKNAGLNAVPYKYVCPPIPVLPIFNRKESDLDINEAPPKSTLNAQTQIGALQQEIDERVRKVNELFGQTLVISRCPDEKHSIRRDKFMIPFFKELPVQADFILRDEVRKLDFLNLANAFEATQQVITYMRVSPTSFNMSDLTVRNFLRDILEQFIRIYDYQDNSNRLDEIVNQFSKTQQAESNDVWSFINDHISLGY
jgi:hypothetical protein